MYVHTYILYKCDHAYHTVAFSLKIWQTCFHIIKLQCCFALSGDFSFNRLELMLIKLPEAVGFHQQSVLKLLSKVLCPEALLKISDIAPA